jgi:hypothetical protein
MKIVGRVLALCLSLLLATIGVSAEGKSPRSPCSPKRGLLGMKGLIQCLEVFLEVKCQR